MPEFQAVHQSGIVTIVLRVILGGSYLLALLSLLLDPNKTLGFVGLALAITAASIGTAPVSGFGAERQTLYFWPNYFIINVIVVCFVFIPMERFFPRRATQTVVRPEWQEDMFYYLVSSALMQVLSYITLAPSIFVSTTFELDSISRYITELPFWIQVILIMMTADFIQYWVHRLFHTVPFLWRFHSIHHSTQSMDWLAGARMHILEIGILRALTAVPMFTLGFKLEAVQAYLLVVYFYSSFIHANIGWKMGWLERWFVTPRFHHWHHGSERAAIDINYASHFPIYDWLFSTYHMPDENEWPKKYGVAGETVPRGYFRQAIYPFMKQNKTKR